MGAPESQPRGEKEAPRDEKEAIAANLTMQIADTDKLLGRYKRRGAIALVLGSLFVTAAILYVVSLQLEEGVHEQRIMVGILGFAPYAVIAFIYSMNARMKLRDATTKKQELELEKELIAFPIPPRQVRAERLFRRNEQELLKYYTLNLGQSRVVLGLGVACIVLGLTIVGVTMAIIGTPPAAQLKNEDVLAKGLIAGVGAISAVLTNYVAAIYLKMHGETATALSNFHQRLVTSNNLFLANVLVSRIETETDREKALAAMALDLVKK